MRVYPTDGDTKLCRNHQQTVDFAQTAVRENSPEFGVKGPSMFMLLPHFDIIHGFPPDYMHSVLLGVVRQMAELFFDSSHHQEAFYLGRKTVQVDKLLLSIKPPKEIVRLPRSVASRKFWKAKEWGTFLLYYSPIILQNILPAKYFRHWLLLVNAILGLLQTSISQCDLVKAQLCLQKFVVEFKALYGLQNITYNVHLLTHLGETVEHSGPLSESSAFVFEDANGWLLSVLHGTRHVDLQAFKWFAAQRKLESFSATHLNGASDSIVDAYNRISKARRRLKKFENTSNGTPGF